MNTITVANKEYEPKEVVERAVKACGWFRIVAVFSLINTALHLLEANLTFVIGLGATQVVDGLVVAARQELTGPASIALIVLAVFVDVLLAAIFLGAWWFSKAGSRVVYVLGMLLYLLDALLFIWIRDWVGIAFHGFFLFMMFGGYQFVSRRRTAEGLLSGAQGPVNPPQPGTGAAPAQSGASPDSIQERPPVVTPRRPPVLLVLTGLCFLLLGAQEIVTGVKPLLDPEAETGSMSPARRTGFLVGRAARVSLMGVLPVVCGIGLLALRPWARIGLLVYLPLVGVPTALFLSWQFAQGFERGVGTDGWNSTAFVLCLLLVLSWYGAFFLYLCQSRTRALFSRSGAPVRPADGP